MNLVFLSPVGLLGGAERSLLDLIASLRQANARADKIHLIVATQGPLVQRAKELGIEVTLLPMPQAMVEIGDTAWEGQGLLRLGAHAVRRGVPASLAIYKYSGQLRKLLRELQPSLIHSNGIKSHLLTRLIRLRNVPIVWHIRDFVGLRPMMRCALHWASGSADAAIAISQAVASDAREVLKAPIDVVYNAIDVDYFSPAPVDGELLDRLAGMPAPAADVLRVGLIATFARWKGHDVFLQAVQRFLANPPDRPVRFYVVGGPIYHTQGSQISEAELRAKADELRIAGDVGFIRFQENVAQIFRALDVVVHASTHPEPFGRTIVEGMACGKPVIVAPTGGAVELFTDGRDALGFLPGDADSLARQMRRLVDDSDLRARIGAEGRKTAIDRFARERLAREVSAIYERVIRQVAAES